jgi:hypothetical protein
MALPRDPDEVAAATDRPVTEAVFLPDTSGLAGHPRGLSTLFFTEMWERFSYYGMRALLMLFMVAPVATGGMGMSAERAAAIYGLYTGSAAGPAARRARGRRPHRARPLLSRR